MKRLTAFIAVLLMAAAALAAKQPITHEALWLLKRVGAPVISPDGRWVVFSAVEPAYDEKDQITDLWIVPADGSAKAHKITFSKTSESDVTWSPDSRRIAFSAKREGDDVSQLYILDIAGGGEAQRMSTVSTAVRSPKFSDDGRSVLFVSSVFRGAADDEANKKAAKEAKDRKANVRVYESYPIRNWDRWIEPDKQVHIFVQPLTDGAKAKDILAGTQLVTSAGFGGTSQGEGGETIRAQWSPDGQWIVFGITTERNTAAYAEVGTDLYRVRVSGGEPERIAHGEGSYAQAKFSPDGKTLYTIFNANNKLPYNNNRLVAFDWPSMTNRREIVGPPFD